MRNINPFRVRLFSNLLLVTFLMSPTYAHAQSLTSVFAKDSEWQLFVDGWDGVMTIKSMIPRQTTDGKLEITSDVIWFKMPSRLKVVEYPGNVRRDVEFVVASPDGERFTLTGRLAHGRVPVMAGTSRSERNGSIRYGSWYAKRTKAGVPLGQNSGDSNASSSFQAVTDPITMSGCSLSGQVTGALQHVQGVWLRAADGKSTMIEVSTGSNFHFKKNIAAGSYTVAVVANGKIGLRGSGLEHQFECADNQSYQIHANVTGITE